MGFLSSLFGGSANAPLGTPKGEWSVLQGTNNARPMFVRVNTGLKSLAGLAPFQDRVGVAVPFHAADQNGLPGEVESEQLSRLEDVLTRALTASGKAYFALAITTNGSREFVFYTSAPREIARTLERVKEEITSHKVQYYVKPDAAWEVYKSFAK